MWIKKCMTWEEFEPWCGAKAVWEEMKKKGTAKDFWEELDGLFPDGLTETEVNDILWFDDEFCKDFMPEGWYDE